MITVVELLIVVVAQEPQLVQRWASVHKKIKMKNTVITNLSNSEKLAKKLSKKLSIPYFQTKLNNFPDGEIYLQFTKSVKNKHLIICQTFQPNPNQSLQQIIFAAKNAKELGVKKITLVAPYLGFMRQDKRFHAGENISANIMAELLSKYTDKLITIDPHLHRIRKMNWVFKNKAVALTSNPVIADYIQKNFKNEVIIGPDWESYQWAQRIAKRISVMSTVLRKVRLSSRKVESKMVNPIEIKNKNVIIVDDIISTGHTIMEAAKKAKKLKAKSITAICIHGLFVEGAIKKMKAKGVKQIICTNTIEKPQSKIDITSLLAEELKK
jgi:ribose-phosphate pyrophosphokinase